MIIDETDDERRGNGVISCEDVRSLLNMVDGEKSDVDYFRVVSEDVKSFALKSICCL